MIRKMSKIAALGLIAIVTAAVAFGGDGQGQGKGAGLRGGDRAGRGELKQKLLDGTFEKMIDERIQKIEAKLAEHPNAPAEVKAAAEKLIADLKDKKADLQKLAAALKAEPKDKEAVKADMAELKKDREQLQADRKALCEAIKAAHPEGAKGGKLGAGRK